MVFRNDNEYKYLLPAAAESNSTVRNFSFRMPRLQLFRSSSEGFVRSRLSCFVAVFLALFAFMLLTLNATGAPNLNRTDLKEICLKGCSIGTTNTIDPSIDDPYMISLAEARRQHNENGTMDLAALQYGIIPEIKCPVLVRVGTVGDGGKWVCNPWLLKSDCVIYSLGVNNEVSFEMGMSNITKQRCYIYGFDMEAENALAYTEVPKGEFRQWLISSVTNEAENKYSMTDVMKTLGHTQIDILKMDIEEDEFFVIPQIFGAASGSGVSAKACQLLIEIHPLLKEARRSKTWISLFKTIGKAGFLLFSREANANCNPPCYEYSFLHESCLDVHAVAATNIQRNFDLT